MGNKSTNGEHAVVITTAKRAVVFGYTRETGDTIVTRGTVTILRARMCTYWSRETHGVMGLAGIGPQKGSRVGPQVPEVSLNDVTSVQVCAPEAVTAWEAAPWS